MTILFPAMLVYRCEETTPPPWFLILCTTPRLYGLVMVGAQPYDFVTV